MTFQKGNRANPNGRPKKGQATAEILRAIGDLEYKGSGQSFRERAAHVLWEQACAGRIGSLEALKFIVERTEGKVTDKVQQSGTVTQRIRVDYGDGAGDRADD